MAQKPWSFVARSPSWVVPLVIMSLSVVVRADDLKFSAQVDKTTVEIGDPVTLTITLGGDLTGLRLPDFQFPDGFVTAARTQATNVSVRAGVMERSLTLVYVLMPQQAGTFQLGPFQINHEKKELSTQPIEITVKKPALPPRLRRQPDAERFTL